MACQPPVDRGLKRVVVRVGTALDEKDASKCRPRAAGLYDARPGQRLVQVTRADQVRLRDPG